MTALATSARRHLRLRGPLLLRIHRLAWERVGRGNGRTSRPRAPLPRLVDVRLVNSLAKAPNPEGSVMLRHSRVTVRSTAVSSPPNSMLTTFFHSLKSASLSMTSSPGWPSSGGGAPLGALRLEGV